MASQFTKAGMRSTQPGRAWARGKGKTKMFQQYIGEGEWIEVPEQEALSKLSEWYKNVDIVISDLKYGAIITTPHAFWRYIEVVKP